MRESDIQNRVLLAVGSLPGVRLFRNHCGEAWHGKVIRHEGDILVLQNPRRVSFGLMPGSPDLVGWRTFTPLIQQGEQQIAQFVGLEVKTTSGRASEGQSRFLTVLREAGGLAEIVTSPDQAVALFGGVA